MLNKQQIFNDFVVLVIFLSQRVGYKYEFIVLNGQTATSAFHKEV